MSRSQRQRENSELLERLRQDGTQIARHFGLSFRCIDAERANVKRHYGICYSDGTIRIRLRHATSGEPLRYSSLINTLCHELAHLRHFDHGERFKRFYYELLGWARHQRIYCPARPLSGASVTGYSARGLIPLQTPQARPLRPDVRGPLRAPPQPPTPDSSGPVGRPPEQLALF